MIQTLWKNDKVRFLVVGGINTVWALGSYPVFFYLMSPLQFHYLVILFITYPMNTLFSFYSQKYLVFRTRGNSGKELLKFSSLQALTFLINLLCLPPLVTYSGLGPVLGQTALVLVLTVLSYFFHRKITFRRK